MVTPSAGADAGRAVVVGGSLAGLVAALALARRGMRAVVLERSAGRRPDGAVLVVDRAELGRTLGERQAGTALRHTSAGLSGVAVTWRSLHAGLLDVARADPLVELRHRVHVRGVAQSEDHAWVTTDCGAAISGSVVIGADGHRSAVRRAIFPEHADSTYAGYTLWSGEAGEPQLPSGVRWPANPDLFPGQGSYLLGTPLLEPGVAGRADRRHLSWGWYDARRDAFLRRSGAVDGTLVRRSLSAREIPDDIYDELAVEARRTWHSPWREAALDSIGRRAVICTPICEYLPNALVHGRVAVVGDAAHGPSPMTGMGFGASVTDARVVAEELSAAASTEARTALETYEHHRLDEVQGMVIAGQRFSRAFGAQASSDGGR